MTGPNGPIRFIIFWLLMNVSAAEFAAMEPGMGKEPGGNLETRAVTLVLPPAHPGTLSNLAH